MSEFDADSLLVAMQQFARKAQETWQALPAPAAGHGGPECQWCPLCQLLRQLAGVLRGEHPEIAERLAEAGAAVSNAVRLLVDAAPDPTPPDRRKPRPRVQRIVLDDSPED